MNIEAFAPDTNDLDHLCRRLINSHDRLQQLKRRRAPGIAIGDKNRPLEDAFYALLNHDDVAKIVALIGGEEFVNYLNQVAGTKFRLPTADAVATANAA